MVWIILARRATINSSGNIVTKDDYYPFGLQMPGLCYNAGNNNDRLKYSGKELDEEGGLLKYHFGWRDFDPLTGRWFVVDPARQFASPYVFNGNNGICYYDEDGRFAWFVPVIIGAVIGGTTGAIVAENNDVDWWKGAISGAIIGASIGAFIAPAIGASGMTATVVNSNGTALAVATKSWGITTSTLNSSIINMASATLSGNNMEDMWKFGLVGAATGTFNATGGLGLAEKGLSGKLAYQALGTASRSIGNNWAAGEDPFSKVSVGFGPVNLTLGKGQKLLQWENNIGNIFTNSVGMLNYTTGGKISFGKEDLSLRYSGGLLGKTIGNFTTAIGPHAVMSQRYIRDGSYFLSHEMSHVWQSRALGDNFLFHYLFQGVHAFSLGKSWSGKANYFEAIVQVRGYRWY